MANRKYWLDLFARATWNEFKAAGAKVSGFRKSRRSFQAGKTATEA
ncbi:MAG TPA: hypothetical protein VLM91_14975 [Candidatus Methylomirabilis sp.]|nr:hypothetical protein [Candidatus Methylomirabilis sp.]